MDSCDNKQENKKKDPDPLPTFRHVFQPTWFRCPICPDHEMDRVLLDYGYNFLLPISIFFWIILALFY